MSNAAMTSRVETGGRAFDAVVCVSVLVVVTLFLASLELSRLPHVDEIYTILAGRGWLESGVPAIADGVYVRARLYSTITGAFFGAFGESLEVARLPALVSGALLVIAVVLWTRAVAGPLAAWVVGLSIALAPLMTSMFQFARFYALHALLFWLASVLVYAALIEASSRLKAAVLLLGALAAAALAFHLQTLTMVGILGLGAWAMLVVILPFWSRLEPSRRLLGWLAVAAVAAVLAAFALTETGAGLIELYRQTPLAGADTKNHFWYYHLLLLEHYQTLWSLFPITVVVAIAARPKPALFCALVFAVSLFLLSFGGMKNPRYVAFLLPFLFVLWGIALAAVLDGLTRWLRGTVDAAVDRALPSSGIGRPALQIVLLAGIGLFLVGANGATSKTALSLVGVDLSASGGGLSFSAERDASPWAAARDEIMPLVANASVVMTSRDLYALYFLGRSDITLNKDLLSQITSQGTQFVRDHRTGKPIVSSADAVRRVLACYPDGLVLSDAVGWRQPIVIDDAAADAVAEGTTPVPLQSSRELLVFRWQRPPDASPPADCPTEQPRTSRSAGLDLAVGG